MAHSTLTRTSSSTPIDSIESDVELISRYNIVGERITPFGSHILDFRDNTITFFSRLNYVVSSADLHPFTSQESDPTSAKSNHHTELGAFTSQESDPISAKSNYRTELGAFTSQESDPTSAKREYHARLIYDDIKVTYLCTAYQNATRFTGFHLMIREGDTMFNGWKTKFWMADTPIDDFGFPLLRGQVESPEGKISSAFWAKRHHSTSAVPGIYYAVLTERELKAIRVWEDKNVKQGHLEEDQEDGNTEDS